MISMFDANKSGTIDVNEFGQLFSYVQQWRGIFMGFDKDRSGSIEAGEFSGALAQMGFNLSPQLVQVHYFVTRRIKWMEKPFQALIGYGM